MSIERRIIPISSGKGGVGKTTFAVNYALVLARHGRTVLLDLDTGTSSVRNAVDVPVEKDLYHFFKKGHALRDCVTTLDARLDPRGEYGNFGFVASPRHFIEEISNLTPARREQLVDGINELKANFIVVDLKAGLDLNVVEFLPYSNSGILVFTPHLPAATLAAADIVKAVLFRKLRVLFAPGSPLYEGLQGIDARFVNGLIDRVEDTYDSSVHDLDGFVQDLHHALGDHPVVRLVAHTVESFSAHYVLNRFDGVRSSYDTAVKPFTESLAENVSGRLTVTNLGWVVEHERINEANVKRIPALLLPDPRPRPAPGDEAASELERLAALHLPGRKADRPRPIQQAAGEPAAPKRERYLDVQLDTLRRMFEDLKGTSYRENFRYVASRTLHLMSSGRKDEFGCTRLYKPSEMVAAAHLL